MIRPFLNDMTMSELHAVMTGGFATIAGSVLGAYISFGVSSLQFIKVTDFNIDVIIDGILLSICSFLTYP